MSTHENDLIDKKASHLLKGQEQVLDVLEDMEEDELEAFIENMNENEVSDRNRNKVLSILDTDEAYLNGKINKVYDNEDIEQVINKMSDNELKVVLKNVEDQKLGEIVTSMNDQDFNEVRRNIQGDTEEISMARDIIEMIQSEELDTLTHQKLEQHSKELSQSRKRRDLNDVLRGNIDKTRRRREIKKSFQGFSSSDLPSTFAGHQKLMANIVEKEKESRKRKRRATDILEKQKDNLRSGVAEKMYKEPTYLAANFEPERESEERKKSAGYIGLLSLYEHSRKRRHAIKIEDLDGDSDGFGSSGMDWLFGPDTGHQAEPEYTQGDNGDLYHHPTTISLGSNVHSVDTQYRTSAETSTTTENTVPYEKLTLSIGAPHQNEEYSVPQADRKNNVPNEKLTLSYGQESEDTQGHDLHHHPTTTISLGSNVHAVDTEYRTSAEMSTTENNAPNEKLTLSYGQESKDIQGHDLHHPTTTISLGSNVHAVDTQHRTYAETSTTTENNAPKEKLTLYGQESEDTQGHDLHHHPTTTISLGSNVHAVDTQSRTSEETSTTTENNAPNEKLTLSIGAPKRFYFSHGTKPLKNSHIDTLKSVKFPYDKLTLSYGQKLEDTQGDHGEYSVPQADQKNNAPIEKLTLSYGQESEDTQGDRGDLYHHPTTISLGSARRQVL